MLSLKTTENANLRSSDKGEYLDITAPLYWWKEFDTYKVGTVANSCSTMHKIADKEFTLDDFSYEHLNCEPYHRDWIESATVDEDITSPHKVWMTPLDILRCTIEMLTCGVVLPAGSMLMVRRRSS